MKKYFLGCLIPVLLAAPAATLASTSVYTADFATVFQNPERGFHNRYEIINDTNVNPYITANSPGGVGYFNPDSIDRTFTRAKAIGNTLIHSYIHLDNYTTVALPQALLDNLGSGLAAIRAAGLKIVLRPAYSWSAPTTVPESLVLSQIDQLNAVIATNADVVEHLEAGWLGAWGEWHDSPFTDAFNRAQADTRYRVVKEILNTTPGSIPVVIRYPIFLQEINFLSATAIPTNSTGLTQSDKDRLGFHDDCFLADPADMGTYDQNSWLAWFNPWQKRAWITNAITSYGGNIMVGGESCDAAGDNDAVGNNVQYQMAIQHFTEINEDYAPVNTTVWKNANLAASGNDPAETAFVRIKRKMGYRVRLMDATFSTSANAGNNFTFSAHLVNDGYASVIKPRPIFLVFQSETNRFNLPLTNVDVRTWRSGPISLASQTVALPSNMPTGNYTLALWLPDNDAGLQSRPEYSIRLANQNIWDAANGYNVLAAANQPIQVLPALPPGQPEFNHTTNDGSITITGYNGPGGSVAIPGTINGLPVAGISTAAFASNTSLTNITIPGSVTHIGTNAFGGCSSLTSVYFTGDAPSTDATVFAGDNVTVYYLPVTSGWAATFAGVPAMPMLPYPMIQNNGPAFGVQTNGFGFNISWATNIPVIVEACTSLTYSAWQPLQTNALVSGSCYFSDPRWTNHPGRFYRVRTQFTSVTPPTNSTFTNMVLIPGGLFVMGDSLDGEADAPTNSVQVSAFYMDAHHVTERLWTAVYNWAVTNGYDFDHTGAEHPKGTNYPVQTINWYDCVKWCNARSEMEGLLPAYYTSEAQTTVYRTGNVAVGNGSVKWSAGYRLPTEAEWEKAARGGRNSRRFPWGDTIAESQANYIGEPGYCAYDLGPQSYNSMFYNNVFPQANPVGYFAPNEYGLYDMAGNIWQWCWDWYGSYPSGNVSDPRGSIAGMNRVIRGGSWTDFAPFCRSASRSFAPASYSYFYGFRAVLPSGQP